MIGSLKRGRGRSRSRRKGREALLELAALAASGLVLDPVEDQADPGHSTPAWIPEPDP